MPVTNVGSRWSSGDLIFYEKYVSLAALGNIMRIGDDAVEFGSSTNDIDVKIWMGTEAYAEFNYGTSTLTLSGVDATLTGNLTVDVGDVQLGDNDYLMFGDGAGGDVSARWVSATSLLEILPLTDAVGAINIGNGTKNMDVKMFGATGSGYYLLWDESGDDLILAGATATLSIDATGDSTTTTDGSFHTDGGAGIAKKLFVGTNLDVGGTAQIDGTLTVGVSDDGETVTFYGDTAGSDFVWAEAGDTNGSLTLGATTKSVDFRVYGTTATTYLHWDGSGDDLLLIGTATQLAVAGTTNSTTTTSGSLRTAGGCAVLLDFFLGGDFYLASGGIIDFNAGDVTITHSANTLTLDGGTLTFTSAQTDYILIGTNEGTLLTGSVPASPEVWDAVGVFVEVTGTSTRTSSMSNENHAGNFLMQEAGQTYFNFGLQGRSYIADGGTAMEMYGVHGRARILNGGTVGSGSAGGFIGVLGEANNQSGGTVDMGAGTSIYAGVRGIFNNAGTLTSAGKSCGVMADVGAGTSDCVLYMLSGGGTTSTSIMEINNSGTSTNLLKIQTAAGFASVNASFSGAGEPDASLEVLLGGVSYFLYLYDTEVT